MPQIFNLNPPPKGMDTSVRSVRCSFWASAVDRAVEVAPNLSHYVEFEMWTQNNANGQFLGMGHIDVRTQSAMDLYKAATIPELFALAFD